ncbi:uncharacterized protein LOC120349725 [Nilaparvata lugens]|uniref:uncharacterized protein LOC120349725 n=1 Tax=Nilaparvata lugens TaxID=108931 RepID=UPI00193D829E|nr:uncharacterized protein LOC120349725 [Nilaparvata lugens]
MSKAVRCQQTANSVDEFVVLEEAFKSRLTTLYYNNAYKDEPAKDFHTFLSSLKDKIVHIIIQQLQTHGAMKFNLVLEATYFRSTLDKTFFEQEEFQNVAFKTPNYTIFSIINLPDIINQACMTLLDEESKFEGNSSGRSLLIIDGLLIRSRPQSITPVIQPQPVIQPPPVAPPSPPVVPLSPPVAPLSPPVVSLSPPVTPL